MNCKPGDLAIVVSGSPAENVGRVITCLRWVRLFDIDFWYYEGALVFEGERCPLVADDCLRPLRPDEGTDEMLRIAGLPAPRETTPA